MSGSEPVWADQGMGGGWWSSPQGTSTELSTRRRSSDAASQVARSFYPRLAVVKAVYNDGSRPRAVEIADWVTTLGCGATAYVEQIALGNWGVVVLRRERPEALWVLTDQHLVLDQRRQPQIDVFSDDEFRACYEVRTVSGQVRECPIYEDQETAS